MFKNKIILGGMMLSLLGAVPSASLAGLKEETGSSVVDLNVLLTPSQDESENVLHSHRVGEEYVQPKFQDAISQALKNQSGFPQEVELDLSDAKGGENYISKAVYRGQVFDGTIEGCSQYFITIAEKKTQELVYSADHMACEETALRELERQEKEYGGLDIK